jgi:hypothetical protein
MSTISKATIPLIGSSVFGAAGVGITVTQLINPAVNIRGAILTSCSYKLAAATACTVFTGTTAPGTITDTNKPIVMTGVAPNGSIGFVNLPFPVELPPGYGLWACPDTAGLTLVYIYGTYSLR